MQAIYHAIVVIFLVMAAAHIAMVIKCITTNMVAAIAITCSDYKHAYTAIRVYLLQ